MRKLVEVCYIVKPKNDKGKETGGKDTWFIQCRTTTDIGQGKLRLFPYGTKPVLESATKDRTTLETRLKSLHQVYMRGVKLLGKVILKNGSSFETYQRQFLAYSAMSQQDLVKPRPGDVPTLGHLAPFWAVMVADRDRNSMINMHTYT